MVQSNNVNSTNNLSKSDVILLMGVYLDEWKHRDELFWKQVFKYFYVNIIVIVLPNVAGFIKIKLPNIDPKLFPLVGIIMAVVFLYVELGYLVRLEAIRKTYVNIMNFLGEEDYKRISITDSDKVPYGWVFPFSLAAILTWAMFILQIIIACVLLFYSE